MDFSSIIAQQLGLSGKGKTSKKLRSFSIFRRIKLTATPPNAVFNITLFTLPRIAKESYLVQAGVSYHTAENIFTTYPQATLRAGDSIGLPLVIGEEIRTQFICIGKIHPNADSEVILNYTGNPEHIDVLLNFVQWL